MFDRAALHRGELLLDVHRCGVAAERGVAEFGVFADESEAVVGEGLALGGPTRVVLHDRFDSQQLVSGRRHRPVEAREVGEVQPIAAADFSGVDVVEVSEQFFFGLDSAEDDHRFVDARVVGLEVDPTFDAEVQAEHRSGLPFPGRYGFHQFLRERVVIDEFHEGLLGIQSRNDRVGVEASTVIDLDRDRAIAFHHDACDGTGVEHSPAAAYEGAVDCRRQAVRAALHECRFEHPAEVERVQEAERLVEMQPPHRGECEQCHSHTRIAEAVLIDHLAEGEFGDVREPLTDFGFAELDHLIECGFRELVGHRHEKLIEHRLEVVPHALEGLGIVR